MIMINCLRVLSRKYWTLTIDGEYGEYLNILYRRRSGSQSRSTGDSSCRETTIAGDEPAKMFECGVERLLDISEGIELEDE